MHDLYAFVRGPLAWAAFALFFGGCLYRLIQLLVLVHRKERFIYSYMSWKYSLRSILHWITPFAAVNMRKNRVLTVVTFAFHLGLILTPVFLLSHVLLWEESWGLSWWTLPDAAADVLTVVVMVCCGYFLVRRLTRPEVRYVTSASDFIILALVAAPFVTGFLAYHQWVAYETMFILHILSGEVLLAVIPFTRLVHMLFAPLTRAYMGSEFGGVRHARDW
jgi:nitrate reductase gamma subunit